QPEVERPGLDFLRGYAHGKRSAAQLHLHAVGEAYGPSFDAFRRDTLAAVRPPQHDGLTTLLDLARRLLTDLLNELEQSAAGDLSDYPHLHQVRIAGK